MFLEITNEQINEAINKLIDGSINLGGKILGALIIFIIGKFIVNWINKLFAAMLQKRKVDASIQSFLKSIVNITLLVMLFLAVIGQLGIELTSFAALLASVGVAVGMALSGKHYGEPYRVYTILGDGETEEGQVWEAAMFAAHYKLDNLCFILDLNGLQIDGKITEVMNPTPYDKKLEAFGFHVISINAHDFTEIEAALNEAKTVKGKPTAIVMTTTKGKGVSFMENNAGWHGKATNPAEFEIAMTELKAALAELEG